MDWGKKWIVDFNALNLFRFASLKMLVLLTWKRIGLLLRKNHPLRFWRCLSLLNWIGALPLSLLIKLPPRELEPWKFILWSYFLLKLLCISINFPHDSMIYSCHVSAGSSTSYLETLNKLQKWICRTVGPSLAVSLEPLVHCHNAASLSLFYRYYIGRCFTPFLVILVDCMIFLSPF